jgi:hypothetical protein
MIRLATQAIDAHGGLERWNHFITLSAHLIQGGELWAAKGKPRRDRSSNAVPETSRYSSLTEFAVQGPSSPPSISALPQHL